MGYMKHSTGPPPSPAREPAPGDDPEAVAALALLRDVLGAVVIAVVPGGPS
jgi:hypothetical protein